METQHKGDCEVKQRMRVKNCSTKMWSNITNLSQLPEVRRRIFTSCKRSLGQGYISTPVCHSVQGGAVHGCVGEGGVHGCSGVCMVVWGMHGCGGACMVAGGHVWLWGASSNRNGQKIGK